MKFSPAVILTGAQSVVFMPGLPVPFRSVPSLIAQKSMEEVMRRLSGLLLIVFVFVAVASFAADKRLSDLQMDSITAGQENYSDTDSGVIVLGDSTAAITSDYTITVDNKAGSDVRALNFVVGSGSLVAAGTNIWYGKDSDGSPDWVIQRNDISQAMGDGAYVGGYNPGVDVHVGLIAGGVEDVEYNERFGLDIEDFFLGIRDVEIRFGGDLEKASAEFIVADDSELKYSSANSVALDNGAMTGVKALNVVSAARSLVALPVNLAVTSQDLASLRFIHQVNTITQRGF